MEKSTTEIKSESEPIYRFEAGSYGDVGQYMPSIACLKSALNGEWSYHFILVNPNHVLLEEDQAVAQADNDLSFAFEVRNGGGTDAELAMELKNKGYASIDNFNIVQSNEFQA